MAWSIDTAHSRIDFSVRHMMLSKARGHFDRFSGTVDADEQDIAGAKIDVQIDAASINTNDEQRDAHLRSPDFLNVDEFPHLTFTSTSVERVDDSHARLNGDLTIRDVTRPVTLDVEYTGQAKSPWGTINAGFSAETKINRKDWGLVWNVALETGGVLVGEEVTISIELELIQQSEATSDVASEVTA